MGLSPGISDSVGLVGGVDLRMCLSNKFPGGADALVQGPHFENHVMGETYT